MQREVLVSCVISCLIISLVGSIIFLFSRPPESYALFFFFFILAALLAIIFSGRKFNLKIRLNVNGTILWAFLAIASIVLVILQLANIYVEAINAVLYLIVFVLALGLSLLGLFKFKPAFSRIEFLGLAAPLSLAFLALFGVVALILPSNIRGQIMSIAVMAVCISAFMLKRKEKNAEPQCHELTLNNNMLILFATLALFVFIFLELYPQISNVISYDISRNFLQALAFTKDTLGSFYEPTTAYPLFAIYQSSIIYIVKPSIATFQIISITLNIFVILSFYAMATQYLRQYGNETPAIATLLWSTFAGLGWLTFFTNKISNVNSPILSLISQADILSYGDITWRRNFFYLSMEASLTLIFAVLYFLKRNDLSKPRQLLLMTLLLTPIPLMHQYATYLLLFTLLCFAIVCANELKQQLKSTGYSLIIASFILFPINWLLNAKGLEVSVSAITFLEFFVLGIFLIAITSVKKNPIPLRFLSSKLKFEYAVLIITAAFLLSFACIYLWFSGNLSFNFNALDLFGYVPVFLFPVKLGLIGILAIAAIYLLLVNSKYRSRTTVAILASALLLIIFSILIELFQMQYVSEFTFNPSSTFSEIIRQTLLSFRAERMFEIFKIPLALIAAIALGHLLTNKLKQKNSSITRWFIISGIVSLILISGISSTILGFTYYNDTVQTSQLSSSELNIINTMQNNIYASNSNAIIISPQTSSVLLRFHRGYCNSYRSNRCMGLKKPRTSAFRYQIQRNNTNLYLP